MFTETGTAAAVGPTDADARRPLIVETGTSTPTAAIGRHARIALGFVTAAAAGTPDVGT